MKWNFVIANGISELGECADENTIRKTVKESLTGKFPLIGINDFEFVKVRRKQVSTLQLGPGTEYNYSVIKKMGVQGLLYLKVKQGFQFTYNGDAEVESDEDLLKSAFASSGIASLANVTEDTPA